MGESKTDYANIQEDKNYKRYADGHVFTGKQIKNLLDVSYPVMQAIILLDIHETDEDATNPNSRYGI